MSAYDDRTEDTVRTWLAEPIQLSEEGQARVAELVRDTPQQRHWWPAFPSRRAQAMFSAPRLVVAGVTFAILSAAMLVGTMGTFDFGSDTPLGASAESPSPVASPSASASAEPSAVESAIDWETDHIDLEAGAIRIRLGDTALTTSGADVRVHEWVRAGDRMELRARWYEAGASHDLYLGFGPTDGHWSMKDMRYLQGPPGVREAGTPMSPFELAATDADLASAADTPGGSSLRVGATASVYACEGASGEPVDVSIEFDGLRFDVDAPEWSVLDDVRVLVGRGRQPRGDWLGHDGYEGPPVAVACTPSVAATLEDEPVAMSHAGDSGTVAGLVTEEVESGVLRVISDGYRDLRSKPLVACESLADQAEFGAEYRPSPRYDDMSRGRVVAGLDGGIWLFWHDRFVRLGEEPTYRWTAGQRPRVEDDIEVAPDSTVWHAPASGSGSASLDREAEQETEYLSRLRADAQAFADRPECLTDASWLAGGDGALRSYRDGTWEVALHAPAGAVRQVEIGADDSLWVAWRVHTPTQDVGPQVARLGVDGWRLHGPDSAEAGGAAALAVAQDGAVVLQTSRGEPSALWRLTPSGGQNLGTWRPLDAGRSFDDMVMSPDGIIWSSSRPNAIARLDEDGWREWDLARNTDPLAPTFLGGGGPLAVGQDGSVWVKARRSEAVRTCHGVYNFDGTTWTRFLDGQCIHSIDVAPDGWLWLRAGPDFAGQGDAPVDLYAIGPDAPAAQIDARTPIALRDEVATAVLRVDPGPDPTVLDVAVAEVAATRYASDVVSEAVTKAIIEQLGLDERPERLVEHISASAEKAVLTIEVRDEDPNAAYLLALALGEEMIRLAADAPTGSPSEDPERLFRETSQRLRRTVQEQFGGIVRPTDEPVPPARNQLEWVEKPVAPDQDVADE